MFRSTKCGFAYRSSLGIELQHGRVGWQPRRCNAQNVWSWAAAWSSFQPTGILLTAEQASRTVFIWGSDVCRLGLLSFCHVVYGGRASLYLIYVRYARRVVFFNIKLYYCIFYRGRDLIKLFGWWTDKEPWIVHKLLINHINNLQLRYIEKTSL